MFLTCNDIRIFAVMRAYMLSLVLMAALPMYCQDRAETDSVSVKTVKSIPQPDFEFDHQVCDLGTFPKSQRQTHIYTVTNTGDKSLVLLQVATGCGCTDVEYTKDPIPPGATGKIKVTFDGSAFRPGAFTKSMTVFVNTSKRYTRLYVKGVLTDK